MLRVWNAPIASFKISVGWSSRLTTSRKLTLRVYNNSLTTISFIVGQMNSTSLALMAKAAEYKSKQPLVCMAATKKYRPVSYTHLTLPTKRIV